MGLSRDGKKTGGRMRLSGFPALAVVTLLATAGCNTGSVPPPDPSIPGWLRQQISDGGRFPPVIEQVTYRGQSAYHVIATDRSDTGDEHSLFSPDGRLICVFGGIAGQVTSGSCVLDEIVYVSTLYSPDRALP